MNKTEEQKLKLVQKKHIIAELETIGGKYNKRIKITYRKGPTNQVEWGYVWRLTVKGVRAYDWQCLLILADKARDLNCDVLFCRTNNENHYWHRNRTYPCPERLANGIVVYLPI